MTPETTIVFCPRCGSTDAGEGDSSNVPPTLFLMGCGHCGHSAICDDWEIKLEWNMKVDVSAGRPPFVAPLDRLITALRSRGATEDKATFTFARSAAHAWASELPQLSAALLQVPEGDVEAELLVWLRPLGPAVSQLGQLQGFDADTAARVLMAAALRDT
ncbi:MAG: hypothetical protein Q8L14_06595 [Myxococcales bacterium]|nr:hypothetical protein [Myxococcales bacterium]